jgi:hypothetical protein
VITKLTEWQSAMLEKLVGDEVIRARESGWPSDLLNDLRALLDTLVAADVLHAETFQPTRTKGGGSENAYPRIGAGRWP